MSDEEDIEEAPPPLPDRWRKFIDAYMGDANANGVRAARMAGYSGDENRLAVQASRLIRNDKVRKAMEVRVENDHLAAGRIERIRFLTKVMRGEVKERRFVGRDEDGVSVFEDCEPTMRDRLSAEESLSKRSGEQVTKIAATNAAGEDIQTMSVAQLLALASGKVE